MKAGLTRFELARAARAAGLDVRVVAPGWIPKGSGDRVKTDRRDAIRSRGAHEHEEGPAPPREGSRINYGQPAPAGGARC